MTKRNHCERILASIPEVVDLTGLGRTTVYELLNSEVIRSVKIGRRRMVVLASVHKWIAELAAQRA